MDRIRRRFRRIKDSDALDWIHQAYFIDWLAVVIIWVLSFLGNRIPTYQREFSRNDPLISHHHHKNTIPSHTNILIASLIPLGVIILTSGFRRSILTAHHGFIALAAGGGLTQLITESLKNLVGRLRPDFLARCKWDKVLKACTGDAATIQDGRRSFPSGHSSTAFAGMTFLAFWIASQTGAWSFSQTSSSRSIFATRFGRLSLSLLPFLWSTYVAVTRLEDYRHHKEDIIAGSLIGFLSMALCYLVFWRSPWHAVTRYQENSIAGQPRLLYAAESPRPSNDGFELARIDESSERTGHEDHC